MLAVLGEMLVHFFELVAQSVGHILVDLLEELLRAQLLDLLGVGERLEHVFLGGGLPLLLLLVRPPAFRVEPRAETRDRMILVTPEFDLRVRPATKALFRCYSCR